MASSSSSGALGNGFGFGFGGENNNPFNHGGQKRTHSEEDILALLEGLEPGAKRRLQQRLGVTQEAENGGAVGSSEGGNVELPANPYVPQGNEYVEEEQGEEVEEEPVGEGDHHAPTATQVEVEVESEEAVSVAPASTPVIYLLQQPAQVAQPKSVAPATAVPMAKTTMAAKTATMSGKQGDEARDNCPLWKALDTMWEKRTNPGEGLAQFFPPFQRTVWRQS
ncbi:unnamed protein product [Amoebophrya sp. A25]|nr:unnamed protein product [Amoebophrya sp. A25]|eukprot:GSA25T00020024001.1